MKQQLIILQGLPASGKTTYAMHLQEKNPDLYKVIAPSELNEMFNNGKDTFSNFKQIRSVLPHLIECFAEEGFSIIIDDYNLRKSDYSYYSTISEDIYKTKGVQLELVTKFFDVPIKECVERDYLRINSKGLRKIKSLYDKSDIPPYSEPLNYADRGAHLPKAIICDLDGTLALITDRDPYDAESCLSDQLNAPVADLIRMEKSLGTSIILLSGRNEISRTHTMTWLKQHNISFDTLLMRKDYDFRKDSLIKKEIYDECISPVYFVKYVLDDRDQVVNMWRKELNLPCFQVNYGPF